MLNNWQYHLVVGPRGNNLSDRLGGGRHSSVDLSVPTILLPQVRVPITPSMLLSFIAKFVLFLSCEKNENKQKQDGLAHF